MAKYTVGKQWFFPQLGRKPDPGEVIELEEKVAEKYMHNEPGLLAPVRLNTQARPEVVRSSPRVTRAARPAVKKVRARK